MKRVQRKRTKGWTMPENTVYVGRPSKWGNPFGYTTVAREGEQLTRAGKAYSVSLGWKNRVIEMYREELLGRQMVNPQAFNEWLEPLRGKDIACWCPLDQLCHADVLLELLGA